MAKSIIRLSATFNPERGEETVLVLKGMEEVDRVTRLDFLQDVIGELQTRYDAEFGQGQAEATGQPLTVDGMTVDRAQQINGWMVEAFMASNGLPVEQLTQTYANLRSLKLGDMLKAAGIVREQNGTRNANGTTTYHVSCDDRLVAAIYTALHYVADTFSPNPIITAENEVLAKVRIREAQ